MYATYQQRQHHHQQQQEQYQQQQQHQQQRKQVEQYMHQTSNMPIIPIRPRSSLTTDEHCCRFKDLHTLHKKNNSRVILTLAGFCTFLLVLCIFLLASLVYVGKTIVIGPNQAHQVKSHNLSTLSYINDKVFSDQHLTTKSINKHFLPVLPARESSAATIIKSSSSSSSPSEFFKSFAMNASNILKHLTQRLPRELKPYYYKLKLHPDLTNKTFSGDVQIELEVLKPIAFIPVHAKNLQVITENFYQLDKYGAVKCNITPTLTFMYADYEYWITEFSDALEIGNYSLQLSFKGSLTNKIVGLYQSSYWNEGTKDKRWIATTKFEPTYARQAFPCFDEPDLKAKFSVTILRPSGTEYHALSNMNVNSEKDLPNGLTEVQFADSVPMSTYLVCFIVSDFVFKSKTINGGTLNNASDFDMRVFSTAAQLDKVEYALNIGAAITEFYITYFNISYPLPKLDMVAIPDFASGAMENWGIVTYRETSLLYDPKISSSINKQRVATVVAHELAHMWFGNLVTMKWWNDLWLNEGFARYMEFKGVNHVHPEWNMPGQFLIKAMHDVMNLDATMATHPIVQVVEKPYQITELFDSITYAKGGSIVRMLEDLVGPEKFQNATTNYLKRFIYSNAETNDFLNEIESLATDFDVKLIMQTWTQQSGYPMVTVTKDGNTLKLTQTRFFANPEDYNQTLNDSQFNYHWSIPITYFTNHDSIVQRIIFNYNDNEVRIVIPENISWIKFNKDQVGFYRVNYWTDMWQELTAALTHSLHNFSSADRAHLVSDAFALAKANQMHYSIALNLSKYLINENDYIPLSVGISCLSHIKNILYYTDTYGKFRIYVRQLLDNAYKKVTWNVGENHLENLLRQTILNAACAFGHTGALDEARKRFLNWLDSPEERPHPDIRSTVYYYGMQEAGNEKLWQQVWQLFIKEQNAQEKLKLMKSLAASKQPWLLQRYINLAWDENHIRRQDYFECLVNIARNPLGENLVWDYVRDNWQNLVERFSINDRSLGRLIPSITAHFASQSKLSDMNRFFEKYPEAGAGTAARKEAIENVKNNIKWLQEHLNAVTKWLDDQKLE